MRVQPKFILVLFAIVAISFGSCTRYLVSPFNTLSNPYTPTPVKYKDEDNKTATYAGIGLSPGGVFIDEYNDYFVYGTVRLAQSHAIGVVRTSYSASLLFGQAHVDTDPNYQDDEAIYRQAHGGNLSSGAWGANAALSFAVPFPNERGEWRVLGVQGSYAKEFGKYQKFRADFPKTYDGFVGRKDDYWTAGMFTELAFDLHRQRNMGFKIAWSLSNFAYLNPDFNADLEPLPSLPRYFSATAFFGPRQGTGFVQVNFGKAVGNVQMGILLNLRELKK